MKRVLELVGALVFAWLIHGIYTGSKERAAAVEDRQDVAIPEGHDAAPGRPSGGQDDPMAAMQTTTEQPATPVEEYGTKDDKAALKIAGVVLVLSIIAVFLIDPREFTRDGYLAAVAAVAGLTALILGISKIVERFEPEMRFFATFERCMLVIGVLWTSVAAFAAAQTG